jgi:hypothetical protein
MGASRLVMRLHQGLYPHRTARMRTRESGGMLLLAIPFGLVIGLIVGAVGGGGAILALPVLVYVLGEGVGPASTASLIVIALAAAVGVAARGRDGHVCWRLALLFAVPAAAGSVCGALLSSAVSGRVLILTFVPVMLVAAGATWQRSGAGRPDEDTGCPPARTLVVAGAGLGVGLLTGFFGVGGGFMIVPVLTLGLGLAFRRAVATSLVIITLTGLAALTSHLLTGARPDFPVTFALGASTVIGALLGTAVADRLPQKALARGFAIVVALLALFLLANATLLGGPPKA